MADAAWDDGRYPEPPETGLRTLARHWAAWGTSQEWWRQELFRESGATSVEEWVRNSESYWLAKDANNLLSQAVTWQTHNVGDTPGFDGDFEGALQSIQARVLLMPSATDLYFPPEDAEYESTLIPNAKLLTIPSIWGHRAGIGTNPADVKFLNDEIKLFLE